MVADIYLGMGEYDMNKKQVGFVTESGDIYRGTSEYDYNKSKVGFVTQLGSIYSGKEWHDPNKSQLGFVTKSGDIYRGTSEYDPNKSQLGFVTKSGDIYRGTSQYDYEKTLIGYMSTTNKITFLGGALFILLHFNQTDTVIVEDVTIFRSLGDAAIFFRRDTSNTNSPQEYYNIVIDQRTIDLFYSYGLRTPKSLIGRMLVLETVDNYESRPRMRITQIM